MSAKRFGGIVPWPRAVAYAVAAVVMGVVVGELVAMLVFAGSSQRRLDEQAARTASSAPAVGAASADLARTRQARAALDVAVVDASRRRDEALVVARCEFNPSPACPQTHITGLPGAGPENRTANGYLEDTQRQLDRAVVERDRLSPSLDATIADEQQRLTQARDAATANGDRGFGARWLAMNSYTLDSAGATVLRALLTSLFIVAFLFPLLLRLSRAKTTEDRRAAAHATQERARLGSRYRDRGEAGRGAGRHRDDEGRAGADQRAEEMEAQQRDRPRAAAPSRRRGDRGAGAGDLRADRRAGRGVDRRGDRRAEEPARGGRTRREARA